ncbi:MAG: protein BatD [Bacteroidetes bacterium]|nr:protein BatD [Bacteroidota bacterium]
MQSFLQKISLLFLLACCQNIVVAQVKFSAVVSAPEISKNELLQVKFVVDNGKLVKQITPPRFNNFSLVSGPNQESGMSMVNGDVKQYTAISFVLKPDAPGKFTIGQATAVVDGVTLKSNTVSVKVSNTISQGGSGGSAFSAPFPGFNPFNNTAAETPFRDNILKKGENPAEKISRNMFVKVELDKTSCYVGEPVVATYKLYTRLKSESNLVKNPSFNGFSVIDLQQPEDALYKREKLNGREYNVYTLRKAQLYPLQSGTLELEPAQVENDVDFIKEAYLDRKNNPMDDDIFQQFEEATIPAEGVEHHKVTLQSSPAAVVVKPLPAENVPAGFKGAVGKFTVTATLEKNNFTTDDAGNLQIVIAGDGNMQLVIAPDIQWPDGFEPFDSKTSEELDKTSVPVSGKKIITIPFTVKNPGTYVIPAIAFAYFDPQSARYKTDSTQPITFSVTKGTGHKANTIYADNKQDDGFMNTFISNRKWVIGTVAVLILSGLVFWLRYDRKKEKITIAKEQELQRKKQEEEEKLKALIPEEKNWMEKAAALLHGQDSTAFYHELNTAIKNYLSAKLQLPVETINKKNIVEELDRRNIPVTTSLQLQQLLNDIDLQLYTPFAMTAAEDGQLEQRRHLYDTTADTIQLLDSYKI